MARSKKEQAEALQRIYERSYRITQNKLLKKQAQQDAHMDAAKAHDSLSNAIKNAAKINAAKPPIKPTRGAKKRGKKK